MIVSLAFLMTRAFLLEYFDSDIGILWFAEDYKLCFQARRQVPEAILKQIISLNSLDMELYEHAKNIFTQEHLMLKGQHSMVGQHKQLSDQKVCSSS